MPNRKSPPGTALVIGGGVIGLATALALQSRGISTTLLDPGDPAMAASWGNAGHIATEQVEPLASGKTIRSAWKKQFRRGGPLALPMRDIGAWLPFATRLLAASRRSRFETGKTALASLLARAMADWRRLLDQANARDVLREDGHFIVWESEAAAQAGRAAWGAADTGSASFRDATAAELAEIADRINAPLAGGIRFDGSAQIADLTRLATALAAAFEKAGGTRQRANVAALLVSDGHCAAKLDSGERIDADALVVTAGYGSAALLRSLGHEVPLIAERGYHVQAEAADWPADMPPVVFEERAMILTRFETGLRAASFVEFTRAGSSPDPRKWARLRRHLDQLGIGFRGPVSKWAGMRPTFPDYLPAIGKSRRADRLFYAFGHQHLGLTLAATSAELVAAMVADTVSAVDLAPFDLERFERRR